MKKIQKLGVARFQVTTPEDDEGELRLNFNPLIEHFKLVGDFFLIHWQARPKGTRQWGIYSSKDDSYTSSIEFPVAFGKIKLLMMDDTQINELPSAVIYFVGSLKV